MYTYLKKEPFSALHEDLRHSFRVVVLPLKGVEVVVYVFIRMYTLT